MKCKTCGTLFPAGANPCLFCTNVKVEERTYPQMPDPEFLSKVRKMHKKVACGVCRQERHLHEIDLATRDNKEIYMCKNCDGVAECTRCKNTFGLWKLHLAGRSLLCEGCR